MLTVIERARRYIAKCPVAVSGQGGHDATFHVAAVLVHGFALAETDALMLLGEWNRSCVPPWGEADLVYKIKSAAHAAHREARGHLLGARTPHPSAGHLLPSRCGEGKAERVRAPVKPKFCPMVLKRIAGKVEVIANVVDFIRLASPVRVETQDSASVLRRMYPQGSGEKVLIFSEMKSQGQFLWEANRSYVIQNRHLPAGKDGVWFLPQPVDGEFHPNPRLGGRRSRRSEESVTSWRYVVLESDEADPDDWLRCLIQLPLRIACICESGRRSIHALVRLDAQSKAAWDELVQQVKPALVTLGADGGALSAVRLTRLPQARRGERVQRLLYLNPVPDGTSIVRLGSATEGRA